MEVLKMIWDLICSFCGILLLLLAAFLLFNSILVWKSFGAFIYGVICIPLALLMFVRTN